MMRFGRYIVGLPSMDMPQLSVPARHASSSPQYESDEDDEPSSSSSSSDALD